MLRILEVSHRKTPPSLRLNCAYLIKELDGNHMAKDTQRHKKLLVFECGFIQDDGFTELIKNNLTTSNTLLMVPASRSIKILKFIQYHPSKPNITLTW